MDETLLTALALIPALVIAIVFHEVAHGWVALALGDPTAKERKRLTLNPIRHVDPVGTLLVPGALTLAGLPAFGWAKPVPVNKRRLNNPRFGMMAVAAAGPATNIVLAAIAAVLLGFAVLGYDGGLIGRPELLRVLGEGYQLKMTPESFWVNAASFFLMINLFLALFNLLPIPPFDGSHIVEGLLPARAARIYERSRRFGFALLFLLLLVIPWLFPNLGIIERVVLPPALWALEHFMLIASAVVG